MKKHLFLLGFVFFAHFAFAQKHYERFNSIDVQHYRFELQLSDASDKITGIAHVTLKFKKEIAAFSLDLTGAQKDGKGMKVIALMAGDREIPFEHTNDQVNIHYSGKAGELQTFMIAYEGIPDTGLIISKNKYGDRTFFGDNWPDRGHHWLPIVDHPSDKATVEWIVTAPSHYQVIGNGRLEELTNINDNLTLTHWKSQVQLPTKVMVIGAARFAVQNVADMYGITVSSWIYPQDREKGFYDYALAAPIADWFINHIGAYPYAKLANVQSKTQFGGMENASNIFYSENSVTGQRTSEELLAHEIAHQWFGNSASEANWHHVWLSEGFATYFTILYMEQKYGKEKALEMIEEDRTQIIAFSKQNRVPIVNTKIENYMQLLNTNSYQKGGWVLHMLRSELGDEIFWEAIHQYYAQYKLSNALTDDLKEVFEAVSGKDLDAFFNQWVYQAGQPELQITWGYSNGTLQMDLRQTQTETFEFDLEIELVYANGKKETKTVKVTEKDQKWTPKLNSKPSQIIIDPNTKLLFEGTVREN